MWLKQKAGDVQEPPGVQEESFPFAFDGQTTPAGVASGDFSYGEAGPQGLPRDLNITALQGSAQIFASPFLST
jgi:hypothetical protein